MIANQYEFRSSETFLDFEFESDGPKGKIRKVVRYCPQNANGVTYFNLAFGDREKGSDSIDDFSISNNNDSRKVLATVAGTVVEFTSYFPDALIYAEGNSASRTRLYQMEISFNLREIEKSFLVYGLKNGKWENFRKNNSYDAFLAKRK
jgi:hypothetical protein